MEISELFYSIQGEGKRSGFPSFFIRTNFCNLRCRFKGGNLCDTPYTSWEPDNAFNKGRMTIEDIVSEYEKVACNDIVITGGEPAMQTEELGKICNLLKRKFPKIFITLETNGTYFGKFAEYIDLASISPKLMTSIPYNTKYEDMHIANMKNTGSFHAFVRMKREERLDIQWKFVYTGAEDLLEIQLLLDEFGIDARDVFLMPEGTTREQLESKRTETIEACLKNGYNYTDRLHILVWGNKRGV